MREARSQKRPTGIALVLQITHLGAGPVLRPGTKKDLTAGAQWTPRNRPPNQGIVATCTCGGDEETLRNIWFIIDLIVLSFGTRGSSRNRDKKEDRGLDNKSVPPATTCPFRIWGHCPKLCPRGYEAGGSQRKTMADDAVLFERVSTLFYPVFREKTGCLRT